MFLPPSTGAAALFALSGAQLLFSCLGAFSGVILCVSSSTHGPCTSLTLSVAHRASDIRAGAAAGDDLDREILAIWNGQYVPKKASKTRTFRTKFVLFCYDTGALPVLPIKANTYFRYMLWLSKHGVNGWDSAQRYLSEAVTWDQLEMGSLDHRKFMDFFWSKFRHNYKQQIAAKHTGMKLPFRAAMLEAIYLDIDFSSWVDVQDIAAYTFLLFVGVRIGHVAVDAQRAHALRFEDIGFYPSFDDCDFVYFHFRSTKTRPRAADTPYWSTVRAQPHLLLCPVAMLKRIFALNFRGIHTDFVFQASQRSKDPLSRSAFTNNLRLRLARAQRHLTTEFNIDDYSGISFRKGFLTILGAAGLPGYRLAAAADHASIQSSTPYMLDQLRDRAANSDIIGASFVA